MGKTIWIIAGSFVLGLAILGMFLPLLPTVPFLLLAASCYLKGSPSLYHWLISHPYLGKIIREYREDKTIPFKTKVYAILLLWGSISVSIFMMSILWVRILLLLVAIGVTIHILSFKSR